MPEDHPLRAGCIIGGLIERQLISQSDLIITIGLDTVELQPKGWPYSTKVLSFANVPSLDGLVAFNEEVVGNLDLILRTVTALLPKGFEWGSDAALNFRNQVNDALDTPSTGLSPQRGGASSENSSS